MSNDTVIASLKEKIDGLNQEAWEARVNDSAKAFQLSEESVKLARSINYARGLAEGLRSLGFAYIRLFKNAEAAPLLKESLSLFQSLDDQRGQGIVYEYLGIIERNSGNLGGSLELLLKGNALVHQTGPLEVEITSCYQLGVTYKHLGNHENALDYLYKALSLSKKINLTLMEAYAINIIGSIYFDNGDYDHALDCYQQGLVIRQQSHDKWGEAGSLDNIGFTYLKLNEHEKAIDFCKQSLKITQATGDKKGEANTLLHLAEIYQHTGDIGQASEFSFESLEIRKARGDKRGEAEVFLFLADLYKNRGDVETNQVYDWLTEALKIADEIGAQDLLSKAYYNLHEYHAKNGNFKESITQLEAHLKIEKELHKNTINQKVANLEISHKAEAVILRNKELTELNEQIEKANAELRIEASLERVRAVAMGMNEPADMINVCRMISDQLLQLGFREIRNVQTAIIYPQKHEYLNYQYFTPYDKASIETIDYRLHPDVLRFADQMLASPDAYYVKTFEGKELADWREYRKQTNQLPDPKLDETSSSHYYFYSIGSGALGVTTYAPLSDEQIELFKRFRNVFELAYRRFIDIEKALAQAKEAQIEASLERVRAVAMSMMKPEDLLNICEILFAELEALGFKELRNTIINIYNEEKRSFRDYDCFGHGVTGISSSYYDSHPITKKVTGRIREATDAFVELIVSGSELESWKKYREKNGEITDAKLKRASALYYYFYSVGTGALGISTLAPVPAEKIEILERFKNVFDLSYRRYADIEKAQAQAREAQIEAALERVRAKSMAMHHSDDLITVINVVQEQLLGLGFHFHGANFVTDYSEKGYTMWLASPGETFPYKIYVPQIGQKYFEAVKEAIEKGSDFTTYTLNFEEKNVYFKNLFENTLAKNTSEEGKRKVYESKGMAASVVLLDKIRLNLINLDLISFTDEENDILKRFGYVFEQSYTRFLDLQKAEAQARESQIQLAMERVRARTMAMQRSEELAEVATILFQQVKALGVSQWVCGFSIWEIGDKEFTWYPGSPDGEILTHCKVPLTEHPVFIAYDESRKRGDELVVYEKTGDFQADHYRYMMTVPGMRKLLQSMLDAGQSIPDFQIDHIANFSHGNLVFITYEPVPEMHDIFKRFARVFEQTYTRFLDLKKAEAQTREAQIEVAVERVRAKALAMHRSEDLHGVVVALKKELMGLQIPGVIAATIYLAQDDGSIRILDLSGGGEDDGLELKLDKVFRLEDTQPDLWVRRMWEGTQKYFVVEADEADFARVVAFLHTIDKTEAETAEKIIKENSIKKAWLPTVKLEKGRLNIDLLEPPTAEVESILLKMGAGFDLAYRRFLDLQKAEAQTKEAQTEVALERIRARAMAMHSSTELMDVAHILREQMGLLDQPDLETSVVNLFEEDSDYIHSWHAFREPGLTSGRTIDGTVSFRKDSSELTREMIDHYHSGEKEFTLEATGEKLNEFIRVLIHAEPEIAKYIGKHPPEKVYYHFATFTGGALLTVSYQPTTEDIKSLQRRAASVFEMAYRRYRDLKKAEAQTREAQIEIAVERVRAKALAMHRSEEILSVVAVLRNELLGLNIPGVSGTTIYLQQDDGRIRMWDLTSVIELEDGFHLTLDIVFPLEKTHPELYLRKLWNAKEKYAVQIQNRNDLERTVAWLAEYKKEEAENVKRFIETSGLQHLYHATVPLANGKLSVDLMEAPPAEMEPILQKMATAFDLAYKRFLDLQKAEAQAREAHIETGLERVRSKTMAMHKSEEVTNVAVSLNEELLKLGFEGGSTIIIIDKETGDTEQWTGFSEDKSIKSCNVPYFKHPYHDALFSAWKNNEKFLVYTVKGDEKKPLDDHYFSTGYKIFPENDKKWMRAMESVTFSHVFMKYGAIHWGPDHLTEEQLRILQRFSNVFEQSYTRFLDLQKAEAQARESQIQLALERVRARTMAMHKSDELPDTSHILFEQMKELGEPVEQLTIGIVNEEDNVIEISATLLGDTLKKIYRHNIDEPYMMAKIYAAWKRQEKTLVVELRGDELNAYNQYRNELTNSKMFPTNLGKEHQRIVYAAFFSKGMLALGANETRPPESLQLLVKFASVFDLTYTRFLDLQKAEAQAREAQIEAALEKVRAKVMAMNSSKDLDETSLVFGEQLRKLNIDWQFSYFWLIDEAKKDTTFWITWPDYKTSLTSYTMAEAEEYFNDCLISWRAGVKIHDNYVPPEGVQAWLDTFQRIADDAGGEAKKVMVPQTFPNGVFYYDAMMKYGSFGICVSQPATDEEKKIQARFAIEFERAYTRFLDLKQAEAQARESHIELGLERVRARAMAMQKSDELKELIATVSTELGKLDIILDRCFIMTYDIKTLGVTWWMANPETSDPIGLFVKYHEQVPYLAFLKAWQDREVKWQYILEGSVKKTWDAFLFVETELSKLPSFVIDNMRGQQKVYLSASFNNFGCLTLATLEPLSDEQFDIMLRFAKVFDLTYTRFNDLKQAEAQARESQIELGLERVRARAMAMQKSDELKELIGTVSTELSKLDLILDRCFIAIFDPKTDSSRWWMANPEAPSNPTGLFLKYHEMPPYLAYLQAWKTRQLKWVYILEGETKKEWDEFSFRETDFSRLPDIVIANMRANNKVFLNASFNSFGCLMVATLEPLADEHFDIMLRFAKVFDLTYTRFNDLKQAEAQAREAQIEAALERVRSKAMAMHKSDDLSAAVATVFEELQKLDAGILRCGICIMDKEKPRGDVWITVKSEYGNTVQVSGNEPLDYHPLLRGAYEAWKKQEDFSYVLQGDDLISYYQVVASLKYQLPVSSSVDKKKKDQQHYYLNAVFEDGSLFAFMETEINSEAKLLIKRFANVFNLTYKRFLDLQKAEAQTHKAQIEVALERVRARALAMQQPEELIEVAEVLRQEMGLLGVEELETCSIYIHDDTIKRTECWYALKDIRSADKKLVADHFALDLDKTWVGREMLRFFQSDAKQVSIIMQGDNRKEWIRYCENQSNPFRGYYGEEIPDRTYHLYKFSHGAIGAAAAGNISSESWDLLQRAAAVFSLAYSRFKDLTQARIDLLKLKEEKKRAEDALTELQATQKQLIQSEKMASLGELTAGIAHEIQNPLNFVNNFSDVSNELLEEMKHELTTGNTQQAIEIVNDVKDNLEKILHHGKRADAIVKGMLQHSRSSTGQKELTDINTLADEYLRLAYHGLRAKDKFFTAKFETQLDPSLDKINVVPQDIGRVILNLINNSFYAVSEKKKITGNGYEPTVILSTKKVKDKVEIRVKDNGDGIPPKVLDKIFHPFFTTKPTGQGTGLGLSMSYDIITKGHGGEIKVKTKEGEGSEFIISLPVN